MNDLVTSAQFTGLLPIRQNLEEGRIAPDKKSKFQKQFEKQMKTVQPISPAVQPVRRTDSGLNQDNYNKPKEPRKRTDYRGRLILEDEQSAVYVNLTA